MATETQLTLTNSALQEAGGRSFITSLDENSNEARNAALVFSKTVRSVLALVPWDFATKSVQPNPILFNSPIPPGWQYAYARPNDALMVQQVFDSGGTATSGGVPIFPGGISQSFIPGGRTRYATQLIGGARAILCNSAKPTLTYTFWNSDFDSWSPGAIEVLIITLAARLAIPISGDKTLRDRLKQEQMQLEARWKTMAANETVDVQDTTPDWLKVREAEDWTAIGTQSGSNAVLPAGLVDGSLIPNLPTTPPAGSGQFWNDGGLLAITG